MNKAILIGRLTKDPEIRYTQSGKAVSSFTLAIDRPFKDENGNKATDFIPVVAWGKTAEVCGKYLTKGRQTAVMGRIQTRSYTADDGSRRYVTEVLADEIEFIGNREKTAHNQSDGSMNDFTEIEDEPF